MASGFQTPITIKDAMVGLHLHKYLLPSIQREFTWQSEKIEMLFDSIMRDYPINSFMFWKISSPEIKRGYQFYEFQKNIVNDSKRPILLSRPMACLILKQ
jgi:uncharacterized protein with ParB-like and HNH nuclease domain